MKPDSPVKSDLVSIEEPRREMAARHLATISSGASPEESNFLAESLKKAAVSSGIDRQAIAEDLDAAMSAASEDGGPASSNLNP
mmetsp:Transcript_578/g.809  ORF Transcript_578/g.809 Transcript_578/m.809 type:complete len:84 (+) Transcript_578:704-955(+)